METQRRYYRLSMQFTICKMSCFSCPNRTLFPFHLMCCCTIIAIMGCNDYFHRVISCMLIIMVLGCSQHIKRNKALAHTLQTLVNRMIDPQGDDPVHNALLLVESPGFHWQGAAGMADGRITPMTAEHTFKLASIGKVFTAVIILQLMEEGYFSLDDPISRYLDIPAVRLERLMIHQGTAYGRSITIRQLLQHTSGIADYMEDPRFIPGVLKDPKKQYNAAKILDLYYAYQTNEKGVFPPGRGFNYSDVNYVLLALLIEQVTEEPYHIQLNKRIFAPLGMDNSYLEYYEAPRGDKPLSHAFFSTIDLVDDVNTSFDWGGGGIVSTCAELNTFIKALLTGRLFKQEATLKLMLSAAEDGLGGQDYDYGLGIMKRNLHGLIFYGHGGAYDCDVFYCPKERISVCMSLNQMNTHGKRDALLLEAVRLVLLTR